MINDAGLMGNSKCTITVDISTNGGVEEKEKVFRNIVDKIKNNLNESDSFKNTVIVYYYSYFYSGNIILYGKHCRNNETEYLWKKFIIDMLNDRDMCIINIENKYVDCFTVKSVSFVSRIKYYIEFSDAYCIDFDSEN